MGEKFDLLVDCKDRCSSDLITFQVIHDCDDEFHDNAPTCWGALYKNHYIWITKNPQNEYVVEVRHYCGCERVELYKSNVFSVVRRWISRNIWQYL